MAFTRLESMYSTDCCRFHGAPAMSDAAHVVREGGVFLPGWAAALLDRMSLDALRISVRGQSQQVDEVLAAVHHAALRWQVSRTAAGGNLVDLRESEAAPSTWIDTRAAAAVLGVQPRRVRQLIADGWLGGEQRGGRWLVDDASVRREAARRQGEG